MPCLVAGCSFEETQNLNVSDSICQLIPRALSGVELSKARSRVFVSTARSDGGMLARTDLLLYTNLCSLKPPETKSCRASLAS